MLATTPVLRIEVPAIRIRFTATERWSSAAAGEERSDEPDVGWNDLLGGPLRRPSLGR
jgi:hypothetical protein